MSRVRDDELPPLPPGLTGLKGPALVRAALAASRPPAPEGPQRSWWSLRPTRPENAPQRPAQPPPAPSPAEWTPHDAIPATFTPGHWADGTPMPDDIPEEDR